MDKDKAQRIAQVNVVKGQIMNATVVRDANKVIVPQYFDEDLEVFVPITKSWGGGSGGGSPGDVSDLEKEISMLRSRLSVCHSGTITKEQPFSIKINDSIGLNCEYKDDDYFVQTLSNIGTENVEISYNLNTGAPARNIWTEWKDDSELPVGGTGSLADREFAYVPEDNYALILKDVKLRKIYRVTMLATGGFEENLINIIVEQLD